MLNYCTVGIDTERKHRLVCISTNRFMFLPSWNYLLFFKTKLTGNIPASIEVQLISNRLRVIGEALADADSSSDGKLMMS